MPVYKAILLDQNAEGYTQAVLDLVVNHMQQTTPFEKPNMKKSKDETELMVRTRYIDQNWLETRSWYPTVVLTGPIDIGTYVDVNGEMRCLGLEWCNDVWMVSALMDFDTVEDRRAFWQASIPSG